MDQLRKTIIEDLPEISWISDQALRNGAIEAWALALERSSFSRVSEIPGEANPGMIVLRRGGQNMHLSGVTRLAVSMIDYFDEFYPEAVIDRDVVICGALCHDVGKAWECDPKNQVRWSSDTSLVGHPSLRHPVYGAHICLSVGLPEAIAHIAACHSPEGDNVKRSLECLIVHEADVAWWTISAASGLAQPDSLPEKFSKKFNPRKLRNLSQAAE